MKTVGYRRQAAKAPRTLPQRIQDRLVAALKAYAETGKGDVKKRKGGEGTRLRTGSYRAIFIETADVIDVIAIGHRRDIYR